MRPLAALWPLALAAFILLPGEGARAQTESPRRVALVVGNNAYSNAPLLNPVNDAKAMAEALQGAGFEVNLKLDASQGELIAALRQFGNRLREGGVGTAGLFYFAGHGMQIRGRNFLIPVGANIEHEDEVAYLALDAQAVLDKMEAAGNGTNLMILDACRNNPFARSVRSASQGLAPMDAPVGSVIAFATAPGSVASDGGTGGNGLYTAHLLNAIRQPGLKIEEVFKQVRMAVLRDSFGRQMPWEATSLVGDFYFHPPTGGVPAAAGSLPSLLDPQSAIDDALWSALKDGASSGEVQIYLSRFPNGRHAREARLRLGLTQNAETGNGSVAGLSAKPVDIDELLAREERERQRRREEDEAARLAENTRILAEIERWGDSDTDRRPREPVVNRRGIAQGDRYRYRVLDLVRNEYQARQPFVRIDRILADGSLRANDDRWELDAFGQSLRQVDERNGNWVEFRPALPAAELADEGAPARLNVATRYRQGDRNGVAMEVQFEGTATRGRLESVKTPAGTFVARRVDVELLGRSILSDGRRQALHWRRSYWYAPGIALPVAVRTEDRTENRLEQSQLQELTRFDVYTLRPTQQEAAKR